MPHPTRRNNEGNNLARKHLELSERRRAFARKKRRGKRVERKPARKKHKAARARSRLEDLTFGTFNVRTAAVNGVNGIGRIDTLLRPCAVCEGFVCGISGAHGGYETAKVHDVRELEWGADCVGGQEKEWTRCFLDDLRAFGINADQWTTAAQDEGEWRRTAEQGAEHFMAK